MKNPSPAAHSVAVNMLLNKRLHKEAIVKRDALNFLSFKDFRKLINANAYQDQEDWASPEKFLIEMESYDLGRVSLTELTRRLGISVAVVGSSVQRGEIIACENDYRLIE